MLLNIEAVDASLQIEPSLLSPWCAKGVPADPVLHSSIRHPPSCDGHHMCSAIVFGSVLDDSFRVPHECWTVGIQ